MLGWGWASLSSLSLLVDAWRGDAGDVNGRARPSTYQQIKKRSDPTRTQSVSLPSLCAFDGLLPGNASLRCLFSQTTRRWLGQQGETSVGGKKGGTARRQEKGSGPAIYHVGFSLALFFSCSVPCTLFFNVGIWGKQRAGRRRPGLVSRRPWHSSGRLSQGVPEPFSSRRHFPCPRCFPPKPRVMSFGSCLICRCSSVALPNSAHQLPLHINTTVPVAMRLFLLVGVMPINMEADALNLFYNPVSSFVVAPH